MKCMPHEEVNPWATSTVTFQHFSFVYHMGVSKISKFKIYFPHSGNINIISVGSNNYLKSFFEKDL